MGPRARLGYNVGFYLLYPLTWPEFGRAGRPVNVKYLFSGFRNSPKMRPGFIGGGIILCVVSIIGYVAVSGMVADCNTLAGHIQQDLDPGYAQNCTLATDLSEAGEAAAIIGALLAIGGAVLPAPQLTPPASAEVSPLALSRWKCAKCGFVNTAQGYIPPQTRIHCSACGTLNTLPGSQY
jgi:hypothetical protein